MMMSEYVGCAAYRGVARQRGSEFHVSVRRLRAQVPAVSRRGFARRLLPCRLTRYCHTLSLCPFLATASFTFPAAPSRSPLPLYFGCQRKVLSFSSWTS